MAELDPQDPGVESGLSRRKLIRRGMIVGGVALWSAPVVASATRWNGNSAGRPQFKQPSAPKVEAKETVSAAAVISCGSYPPDTCLGFTCEGGFTICGDGAGDSCCFCDIDATSACVCRNDAFCSDLDDCDPDNGNGDCPVGWFCLPTTCCPGPKCAPPCGTMAGGRAPECPGTP